jgi:hypothetical protein
MRYLSEPIFFFSEKPSASLMPQKCGISANRFFLFGKIERVAHAAEVRYLSEPIFSSEELQ